MMMYRIHDCLRTLRERTGLQHYVFEARSRRDYSPTVRLGFIHSINFSVTCAIAMVDPIIGGLSLGLFIMLMIIGRDRNANHIDDGDGAGLDMALIKIDGASHAKKHAQCRFGQSLNEEKRY